MKEIAAYIFRAEISTFHILIMLETLEHDAISKVFSKFLDFKRDFNLFVLEWAGPSNFIAVYYIGERTET